MAAATIATVTNVGGGESGGGEMATAAAALLLAAVVNVTVLTHAYTHNHVVGVWYEHVGDTRVAVW